MFFFKFHATLLMFSQRKFHVNYTTIGPIHCVQREHDDDAFFAWRPAVLFGTRQISIYLLKVSVGPIGLQQLPGNGSGCYSNRQWRRNEFESGGRGTKAPEKNFLVVSSTFLALKAQLVVLVSAFVVVSTVWSVYCLLFFYSWCPPSPAICKSGGRAPVPHGVGATGNRYNHQSEWFD